MEELRRQQSEHEETWRSGTGAGILIPRQQSQNRRHFPGLRYRDHLVETETQWIFLERATEICSHYLSLSLRKEERGNTLASSLLPTHSGKNRLTSTVKTVWTMLPAGNDMRGNMLSTTTEKFKISGNDMKNR